MACCIFCNKPSPKPVVTYDWIGPLETNFIIKMQQFSYNKMNFKMWAILSWPVCIESLASGWHCCFIDASKCALILSGEHWVNHLHAYNNTLMWHLRLAQRGVTFLSPVWNMHHSTAPLVIEGDKTIVTKDWWSTPNEISFHSNKVINEPFELQLCAYHTSPAVMACTKW